MMRFAAFLAVSFVGVHALELQPVRSVRERQGEPNSLVGESSKPRRSERHPNTISAKSSSGTNEVRLLSYNFFIRPGIACPPHGDYRDQRIELFAKHYLNNYDIILFQEVFGSSNRRSTIIDHAKTYGFDHYSNPHQGVRGLTDGGLLTLSKYPIVEKDFDGYCDGSCDDWLALKGALYTLIKVSKGRYIHVFNTHLQASYELDQTHLRMVSATRKKQIKQLLNFMKKKVTQNGNYPVFLAGDFNINARPNPTELSTGAAQSAEYKSLIQALHSFLPATDLLIQANGTHQITHGNTIARPRELLLTPSANYYGVDADAALDHQFLFENNCDWISTRVASNDPLIGARGASIQPCFVDKTEYYPGIQLSDHYGVETILTIERAPDDEVKVRLGPMPPDRKFGMGVGGQTLQLVEVYDGCKAKSSLQPHIEKFITMVNHHPVAHSEDWFLVMQTIKVGAEVTITLSDENENALVEQEEDDVTCFTRIKHWFLRLFGRAARTVRRVHQRVFDYTQVVNRDILYNFVEYIERLANSLIHNANTMSALDLQAFRLQADTAAGKFDFSETKGDVTLKQRVQNAFAMFNGVFNVVSTTSHHNESRAEPPRYEPSMYEQPPSYNEPELQDFVLDGSSIDIQAEVDNIAILVQVEATKESLEIMQVTKLCQDAQEVHSMCEVVGPHASITDRALHTVLQCYELHDRASQQPENIKTACTTCHRTFLPSEQSFGLAAMTTCEHCLLEGVSDVTESLHSINHLISELEHHIPGAVSLERQLISTGMDETLASQFAPQFPAIQVELDAITSRIADQHLNAETVDYHSNCEDECSICTEPCTTDPHLCTKGHTDIQLECGHIFHRDCILQWYSNSETQTTTVAMQVDDDQIESSLNYNLQYNACPNCRAPITEEFIDRVKKEEMDQMRAVQNMFIRGYRMSFSGRNQLIETVRSGVVDLDLVQRIDDGSRKYHSSTSGLNPTFPKLAEDHYPRHAPFVKWAKKLPSNRSIYVEIANEQSIMNVITNGLQNAAGNHEIIGQHKECNINAALQVYLAHLSEVTRNKLHDNLTQLEDLCTSLIASKDFKFLNDAFGTFHQETPMRISDTIPRLVQALENSQEIVQKCEATFGEEASLNNWAELGVQAVSVRNRVQELLDLAMLAINESQHRELIDSTGFLLEVVTESVGTMRNRMSQGAHIEVAEVSQLIEDTEQMLADLGVSTAAASSQPQTESDIDLPPAAKIATWFRSLQQKPHTSAPLEIPVGLQLIPQPKDNSCFFHSIAAALISHDRNHMNHFTDGHTLRKHYVQLVMKRVAENPIINADSELRLQDAFPNDAKIYEWAARVVQENEWGRSEDAAVLATFFNARIIEHIRDTSEAHGQDQIHEPASRNPIVTIHLLKSQGHYDLLVPGEQGLISNELKSSERDNKKLILQNFVEYITYLKSTENFDTNVLTPEELEEFRQLRISTYKSFKFSHEDASLKKQLEEIKNDPDLLKSIKKRLHKFAKRKATLDALPAQKQDLYCKSCLLSKASCNCKIKASTGECMRLAQISQYTGMPASECNELSSFATRGLQLLEDCKVLIAYAEESAQKTVAAIKLQKLSRGHSARKKVQNKKLAITRTQAALRGKQTRRQVARLEAQRNISLEESEQIARAQHEREAELHRQQLEIQRVEAERQKLQQQIEAAKDENLCTVCMENPRDHIFTPCGHKSVCGDCAHIIMTGNKKCPICRNKSTAIFQVFE